MRSDEFSGLTDTLEDAIRDRNMITVFSILLSLGVVVRRLIDNGTLSQHDAATRCGEIMSKALAAWMESDPVVGAPTKTTEKVDDR